MTARRLLAVLVAVALVLGAVWIKGGFDSSGSSATGDPNSTPKLVCAPEVAAACKKISSKVTVEDPGATADRLSVDGAVLGADAWIAPEVWIDLVAERRGANVLKRSKPLASTSLVLVVNQATRTAAKGPCPAGIDWACVAGHPDTLKLSVDGTSSTSGLLTAAAVTAGLLGKTDYASNDFDEDRFNDGLTSFATRLGTPGPGSTALDRVLKTSISGAAIALSPIAAQDIPKEREAEFATLVPQPKLTTRVVIAGSSAALAGIDTAALAAALTPALTPALKAGGWTVPAAAATGVPNSGVMVALLSKWNQSIGS